MFDICKWLSTFEPVEIKKHIVQNELLNSEWRNWSLDYSKSQNFRYSKNILMLHDIEKKDNTSIVSAYE